MDGGGVDVLVECDERRGDVRAWWEGFPVVPDEVPAADEVGEAEAGVVLSGCEGLECAPLVGDVSETICSGLCNERASRSSSGGSNAVVFTETVKVGVSLATIELASGKEVIKGFQNCIVEKTPRNTEGTEIVLR